MSRTAKTVLIASTLLIALMPLAGQAGFFKQTEEGRSGFSGYFKESFDVKEDAPTVEETLPRFIGSIINVVLSFVSVIVLLFMTYGGFLWLTARGNTDQVTKGKTILRNAIIGLIITVASFILTSFVVTTIEGAVFGGEDATTTGGRSARPE